MKWPSGPHGNRWPRWFIGAGHAAVAAVVDARFYSIGASKQRGQNLDTSEDALSTLVSNQ